MTGVSVAAAAGCILPECSDRVVSSGDTQMASFRTGVVVQSGGQSGQVTKLPVQIHCLETFSFEGSFAGNKAAGV
jgi:hypothetical protein